MTTSSLSRYIFPLKQMRGTKVALDAKQIQATALKTTRYIELERVCLQAEDTGDSVTFLFESPGQERHSDFELKLMDIDSEQ